MFRNNIIQLQIIVKKTGKLNLDDLIFKISNITGIDVKTHPTRITIGVDQFFIWKNISANLNHNSLLKISRDLKSMIKDSHIQEIQTSWWKRNSERVFVFMGGTSVIGLVISMLSWIFPIS